MIDFHELNCFFSFQEVPYLPFFEVADYYRGITYNKSAEVQNGEEGIRVLRANNITLSTNLLNFDDVKVVRSDVKVTDKQHLFANDILICAGSGSKEHVGKVAYIKDGMDGYTFGGFMAVIRTKPNVIPRYMFHILTSDLFKKHLDTAIDSSTINNLNAGVMESFRLPVPPIDIQNQVVEILDYFTDLTEELSAELTSRKLQYDYYRNSLLGFRGGAKYYYRVATLI